MAKADHILVRRRRAAQATLDRFKGKPFQFGRYDCAQLVGWHLRAIGNPLKSAARAGTYHSLLGGTKALLRLGCKDLLELMDSHLVRIAPAAAIMGDVIAMPGEEGPGAITIAMGNGRLLGYHEGEAGAVVMHPTFTADYLPVAAWRALPA